MPHIDVERALDASLGNDVPSNFGVKQTLPNLKPRDQASIRHSDRGAGEGEKAAGRSSSI